MRPTTIGTMRLALIDRWLLGAACVAVAIGGASITGQFLRQPGAEDTARGYAVGDRLPSSLMKSIEEGQPGLVIWFRSSCGPCQKSLELYRQVLSLPNRPVVVIAGTEPQNQLETFLAKSDVSPDRVVSALGNRFDFKGTPTVLLIGPDGRVSRVWFGLIESGAERDALLRAAGGL